MQTMQTTVYSQTVQLADPPGQKEDVVHAKTPDKQEHITAHPRGSSIISQSGLALLSQASKLVIVVTVHSA